MNPEIEALMASMRAAQPVGRGSYVEDGRHLLQVEKAMCKRTLIGGNWKESYIIEFKVLESSNPTHEVGSTRTYVEAPKNAGWEGRFKSCVFALCGINPEGPKNPVQDQTFAEIVAALRYDEFRVSKGWPENFLKNRVVSCEGAPGKSQKGTPVTNKRWTPVAQPAAQA
jgi:hypothetical protein